MLAMFRVKHSVGSACFLLCQLRQEGLSCRSAAGCVIIIKLLLFSRKGFVGMLKILAFGEEMV